MLKLPGKTVDLIQDYTIIANMTKQLCSDLNSV